jgi:hypothetical protein
MAMDETERLLVDAFRKIVGGRGYCPAMARSLGRVGRCDGADLVRVISIFLAAIDNGCRRAVTIGAPGDAELTPSEMQLLALIAAAQREDDALMGAHMAFLVEAPHEKPVKVAARLVGGLLLKSDLRLSLPTGQPARTAMLLPVVA